jgi:hypothetical protein
MSVERTHGDTCLSSTSKVTHAESRPPWPPRSILGPANGAIPDRQANRTHDNPFHEGIPASHGLANRLDERSCWSGSCFVLVYVCPAISSRERERSGVERRLETRRFDYPEARIEQMDGREPAAAWRMGSRLGSRFRDATATDPARGVAGRSSRCSQGGRGDRFATFVEARPWSCWPVAASPLRALPRLAPSAGRPHVSRGRRAPRAARPRRFRGLPKRRRRDVSRARTCRP